MGSFPGYCNNWATSSLSKAFMLILKYLFAQVASESLHTGVGKTHGQVHEVVWPGLPVA